MSRYIDADALYKHIVNKMGGVDCSVLLDESIAPSIDIVFCKECKYWHKNRKAGDGMNVFDICYDFQADDFCSYGEREGE